MTKKLAKSKLANPPSATERTQPTAPANHHHAPDSTTVHPNPETKRIEDEGEPWGNNFA